MNYFSEMKNPAILECKILEFFKHKPTSDQLSGINKLSRFVLYDKKKVGLVIKGYAGTGKTTMISSLVKACKQLNIKTVLMAPTGRAAKVMGNYSNAAASTIHRLIYRVKNENDQFYFELAENRHKNSLFIVDESSMVFGDSTIVKGMGSSDLLCDLMRFVYSSSGCKIIFVGDHAQLPPVGWNNSPALDVDYLNENFEEDFYAFELTQVVRQEKGSGILAEATAIRNNIEVDDVLLDIDVKHHDITSVEHLDAQDFIESAFSQKKNAVIICRSNKRANQYNNEIRRNVLWYEDEINTGDLIMAVKNNYFWLTINKLEGFIANGDILEVKSVSNTEEKYGFRFTDLTLSFVDNDHAGQFTCKVVLDSLYTDGPNLSSNKIKDLFFEIEKDYSYINGRKERKLATLSSPYLNALQIKFSYALTCHKAQGGQWGHVFVDHGYLPEKSINVDFLRWMYTSFTRAEEHLYLLNFSQNFILKN